MFPATGPYAARREQGRAQFVTHRNEPYVQPPCALIPPTLHVVLKNFISPRQAVLPRLSSVRFSARFYQHDVITVRMCHTTLDGCATGRVMCSRHDGLHTELRVKLLRRNVVVNINDAVIWSEQIAPSIPSLSRTPALVIVTSYYHHGDN